MVFKEFVYGKTVTVIGFKASLGALKYSPIYNVLYAYDTTDGTTIILENNNTIYLGERMKDSLRNIIQSEDNVIRAGTSPKLYYDYADKCQTIFSPDGKVITIFYDVLLPYIPGRRPIPY